jgi:hypothetical protein
LLDTDTPMTLSDVVIRNAKPAEKDRKVFDGGGLYLLVKRNGAKLFVTLEPDMRSSR